MEERYLYEYDYAKPELTDEFLEHHQILGARWGVHNGPPYPLDSKISTGKRLRDHFKKKKAYKKRVKALKKARKVKAKVSAEKKEIAKTKEEIIRTRDAAAMLKNLDKFTTKEITDFNTREQQIANLTTNLKNQQLAKMTKGQKLKELVVNTASDIAKSALKKGIQAAFDYTLSELASKSSSKILKSAYGKNKDQEKRDKEQDDRISKLEGGKSEKGSNKNKEQQSSSNKEQQKKMESIVKDLKAYQKKTLPLVEKQLVADKAKSNLEYAKSVARSDSNSEKQLKYRSQLEKNIAEIDKLLEEVKKRK